MPTSAEVQTIYRDFLSSRIRKIRIVGETQERDLKDVFVELSMVDRRLTSQSADAYIRLSSQIQPRSALDYWRRVSRSQQAKGETKFRVKPDNLLRRGTKAIVTGAPGCGKTTLLK